MFDKYKERFDKLEEDHESIRKAHEHVVKYQVVYAMVGGSALTLVGVKLFGKPQVIVERAASDIPAIAINNMPVFNNTVNNGGHMRKIVKCLETGQLWLSVTEAAKEQGKTIAMMSQHLNHPDVVSEINGKHFVIEALATN
jgi:hypothetical protein